MGGGNPEDQKKEEQIPETSQRNKIQIQKWQNKMAQCPKLEQEIGLGIEAGQNSVTALDV